MGSLEQHLQTILTQLGAPVAVLVDDIDRCDSASVVRLLEGIQTLFRNCPIVFVIAGDHRWISTAFEKAYSDFTNSISAPARPLGALFLEKLFQFSAAVPGMTEAARQSFWRDILRVKIDHAEDRGDSTFAAQVSAARTEQEILRLVQEADSEADQLQAREVRGAAVRRLAMPDLLEKPSHPLEPFISLIEPNPRAMKRFIMAYGMSRATDLLSGRSSPPELLALWTLLSLRWPILAWWLQDDPERLALVSSSDDPSNIADEDRPLFCLVRSPELRRTLLGQVTGLPRLDKAALRRILGRSEPQSAEK